jgi:hypothetical protein
MFKQAYRELAQMMVVEKFLPDVDAVYFLTHEELGECLNSPVSNQWGERAVLRREAMKNNRNCSFRMCLLVFLSHCNRIYRNYPPTKLCAVKR